MSAEGDASMIFRTPPFRFEASDCRDSPEPLLILLSPPLGLQQRSPLSPLLSPLGRT